MREGLVYVFTGEGKGKTSAALGVAVRAALSGMKVAIVQWYKEKRWPIAEHKLGDKFENIEIYPMGSGFYKLPSDHASPTEHKKAAQDALVQAGELIGEVDLLVLDEIYNAVRDKLLTEKEVLELIGERRETHLVLTGRGATERIIEAADLVTECRKIKHPYDRGKIAVRGLDY
ncbi:MAG: cob(I)yrinic acid a,c-diamide adenosyltransferase [bacterium]